MSEINQTVNILDELEVIANKICDEYCKWPQEYGCQDDYDSDEDELEKMWEEKCQNCPLYQFF